MAEETFIAEGTTSVQALAEILQARLEPAMRDTGNYEFEDLCDMVRNAYAGILWKIHMQMMADGDRTALESLLAATEYPATETTAKINLKGMTVVNLPRDAGIYTVTAEDKEKVPLLNLTKTTPAMAAAPKSKLPPPDRYYRIGSKMYFPDRLPPCTAFVMVVYYGISASADAEEIPRDYADMAFDKVLQLLFPTKQIRADITNNSVPDA